MNNYLNLAALKNVNMFDNIKNHNRAYVRKLTKYDRMCVNNKWKRNKLVSKQNYGMYAYRINSYEDKYNWLKEPLTYEYLKTKLKAICC